MTRRVCAVSPRGDASSGHANVEHILGPVMLPVSCACSTSHSLVRDEDSRVYGHGDNSVGQLDSSLSSKLDCFTELTGFRVREVGAGVMFSVFITVDGRVIFRGKLYETDGERIENAWQAPRGLSTSANCACFCAGFSSVRLVTKTTASVLEVEDGNVIKTALTSRYVLVLTGTGNVYRCGIGETVLTRVITGFRLVSIFGGVNNAYFVSEDLSVFDERLSLVRTRCSADTVNVDEKGVLDGFGNLRVDNASEITSQISCCSLLPDRVIAFIGVPGLVIKGVPEHALAGGRWVINRDGDILEILALDSGTCYTSGTTCYISLDDLSKLTITRGAVVSCGSKMAFYTQIGRLIVVETTEDKTFEMNLLCGDVVETKSGLKAVFVGVRDNMPWLRFPNSHYVFTVNNASTLRLVAREGHEIRSMLVNGVMFDVDVGRAICKRFGRSPGDLVWFPGRGVVQFVGLAYKRLVFLDFSDFSTFFSELHSFLLIRTDDEDMPHTRDIVTTEGKIVTLNVSSKNCIYYPGDRVVCEFGGAMFLGTDENGHCYVQSDEMRLAGVQGSIVSITTMKLTRRIAIKATRRIRFAGERKDISVSVSARVQGCMADDIVMMKGAMLRVIGVDLKTKLMYCAGIDKGDVVPVTDPLTLLYRADINGANNVMNVQVGSPTFDASSIIPSDTVEIDGTELVFHGIGSDGLVFVTTDTFECATSYVPLILQGNFKVLSRPAFSRVNINA